MARGIKRHHILFIDDKQDWRESFQKHHGAQYDVTAVATGRDFDVQLERMLADKRPPDLVLIDLYHSKYPDDEARQAAATVEGERAIDALEEAIQTARGPILAAWDPYGIKLLERTRALLDARGHRDIPLVIYTQQGLTIANNDELKKVSELRGEWMIKNKANAEYEAHRINEMLALRELKRDNYRRAYQRTSWAVACLLIAALGVMAYFHQKTLDLVLSVGVSAALVAIQPFIAKFYAE